MKIVLAILTLSLSSMTFAQSKAGLMIEPIISYDQTDFNIDYPSPLGKSKGQLEGIGLGARVGFHIYESLLIGADLRYSKIDFNDKDNNFKSQADSYNVGPTVVLQLPTDLSVRVWGGYILSGQIDPEKTKGFDVKFEEASGYRVGAGLMLGTVSLNLEYKDVTYDKSNLEAVGDLDSNTDFNGVKLNNTGYVASISFPITM